MSAPIAMSDLGSSVVLDFKSSDVVHVQRTAQGCAVDKQLGTSSAFLVLAKQLLDLNDPNFIASALFWGLKRSPDGSYIKDLMPYGPLDLNDIPVPLNTLTARIYQGLQRVVTG